MAKRPYWGRGKRSVYCKSKETLVDYPCKCKACAGRRCDMNVAVISDSFFDGKYISAVNQVVRSKRHLKDVAARKGVDLEFA